MSEVDGVAILMGQWNKLETKVPGDALRFEKMMMQKSVTVAELLNKLKLLPSRGCL